MALGSYRGRVAEMTDHYTLSLHRVSPAADRAVLMLRRTQELMLECRAVAEQLRNAPLGDERPAETAERIAYGVLVAALEKGSSPRFRRQWRCFGVSAPQRA